MYILKEYAISKDTEMAFVIFEITYTNKKIFPARRAPSAACWEYFFIWERGGTE